MKALTLPLAFIIYCLLSAAALSEEEMDIDQANSLDFQAFHKTKKDAIKLYDSEYGGLLNPKDKKASAAKSAQAGEQTDKADAAQAPAVEKGKLYEIRELYRTGKSERTGYTPSTVVQALHLQMQGFCPEGWRKVDEWVKPDAQDFYMYYQFECL